MWCPKCSGAECEKHWLQVSFDKMTALTGVTIATSMDSSLVAFVKSYSLKYSYDNVRWYTVNDADGKEKVNEFFFAFFQINKSTNLKKI